MDIAKGLLDNGIHPPTMYFPLIVEEALMVEPTESESKAELDRFIAAMVAIRNEIRAIEEGRLPADDNPLKNAPHTAAELVGEWSHPYSREQAVYPVASLIEYILALQKNVRYIDRNPLFYFRDVLPVLNHRYILSTSPEIISSLVKEITENNKIYISHTELGKTPLLEILFTPVTGVEAFSDYLIKVLEELNKVKIGRAHV